MERTWVLCIYDIRIGVTIRDAILSANNILKHITQYSFSERILHKTGGTALGYPLPAANSPRSNEIRRAPLYCHWPLPFCRFKRLTSSFMNSLWLRCGRRRWLINMYENPYWLSSNEISFINTSQLARESMFYLQWSTPCFRWSQQDKKPQENKPNDYK